MPHRLLSRPAFWLGCFAVLMMHLGPLISGVQGVRAPQSPVFLSAPVSAPDTDRRMHAGHAEHAEHAQHHALMGHRPNPHLPEWVNNLKMCGYCELLTLSPALMLVMLFALLLPPARHVWLPAYRPGVVTAVLQWHAPPRAPPVVA